MIRILKSVLIVSLLLTTVYGYGQLSDRKVTVHRNGVPLPEILAEIEVQMSVKFIYSDSQIKNINRVSLNVDSVAVGEALMQLLSPFNISFRIHDQDGRITLKKNTRQGFGDADDNVINFLLTGKVSDYRSKEALPGVNIIIKGTTEGVTTDATGHYELLVNENSILVFSSVGYSPYEALVGKRTDIVVELSEDNTSLEEVVVNAGYYEVGSREMTGNISRVSEKQISSQPVLNPLQAMQGRMPGVQVTQLTGMPGDGFSVQIRGLNTVRGQGANEPLYLVDGIPFSSSTLFVAGGNVTRGPSPLNSINPSDIESIEVLKDADATAIYGSRGSNGVVLITTRRGKEGKTKVDFNVSTGIGSVSRQMNLLNTSQYVSMRKEAFKNDGVTPTLANAPDLLLWDTTRYTDWQKTLLGGTARLMNAQATISGGNASTQFLVGFGFVRQTTVFPGDYNYQKGSSHLDINHKSANSKFVMGMTASFVADKNVLPPSDLSELAYMLSPNTPRVYKDDGTFNWENGTWVNPYADMKKRYEAATRNLITNTNLSFELLPGLKIKANAGINYITTDEKNITPIASQNPATNPSGSSLTSRGSITSWILEPQIDYQRKLGSGKLSMLLGTTFQQTIREKQGFQAGGFINDTQLENLAAASTLTAYQMEYSEYKYTAVFTRANYNWKEKYIVNLTARRDGSSRFGPDKRFANFGAIGGAWIFSNEDFIKRFIPGLSFGKLRGSVGITGSDQIGDYQYLDTYSSTQYTYQGGKGLFSARLVNPDYGWEDNTKIEGGIELGFFNDRLTASASYYHNRSSNQLVGFSLPASTGFTSVQSNLPAVIQNNGLEIEVAANLVRHKEFFWNASVNVTFPANRLVSYPNIAGSSYANTYAVDRSLFVQKKYKSLGVDPQTGVYVFEDVDNNGVLSSTLDTQFIKERSVSYYGGLQNTFKYGGFELQFLFQFVSQTGNNYLRFMTYPPGYQANQPTLVLARWQKAGDVTDIQKFTQGNALASNGYLNASQFGDGVLSDASYVRLQNASLSWTMPVNFTQKIRSEKIRFYVQGQNLLTITDYAGADPETQNTLSLPPLRMVTIGAQLTF